MSYYNCEAERTNARCANENGDVESSNGHLKDRIDQAALGGFIGTTAPIRKQSL